MVVAVEVVGKGNTYNIVGRVEFIFLLIGVSRCLGKGISKNGDLVF